jgi:hypothetical protein
MAVTLNASTSSGFIQTADTSGVLTLQSNGTTQFTVDSTGAYGQVESATAATASGTAVGFTSIPSWVKRITVMFSGVSTNGTSNIQCQFGTGATPTYTTSGYLSNSATAGGSQTQLTTGAGFGGVAAAATYYGNITFTTLGSNVWTFTGQIYEVNGGSPNLKQVMGGVTLGAVATAIRVTTVNCTDTFDGGTINILYEG